MRASNLLIANRFLDINSTIRFASSHFNTLEHWAKDVSEDIAAEIQTQLDMEGNELPEHMRDRTSESHVTDTDLRLVTRRLIL
jgi:hypothetical protein